MKGLKLSWENALGAFLGGVLGFLVFYLIYPLLLPVGCLAGVALGWDTKTFRRVASGTASSIRSLRQRVKGKLDWILASPLNRAKLTLGITVVIFILANIAAAIYCLRITGFSLARSAYPSSLTYVLVWAGFAVGVFVWLCYMVLLVVLPLVVEHWSRREKIYILRNTLHLRRYQRYTIVGFLGYTLLALIVDQIEITVLLALQILYIVVGGAVLFLFQGAPVALAVLILRGLRRSTLKPNLGFCFGATLVTAAVAAVLAQPYVTSQLALWVGSLVCGAMCGLIAEGVRIGAAVGFAEKPELEKFSATSIRTIFSRPIKRLMDLEDEVLQVLVSGDRAHYFEAIFLAV